jgi:hypothetical protein
MPVYDIVTQGFFDQLEHMQGAEDRPESIDKTAASLEEHGLGVSFPEVEAGGPALDYVHGGFWDQLSEATQHDDVRDNAEKLAVELLTEGLQAAGRHDVIEDAEKVAAFIEDKSADSRTEILQRLGEKLALTMEDAKETGSKALEFAGTTPGRVAGGGVAGGLAGGLLGSKLKTTKAVQVPRFLGLGKKTVMAKTKNPKLMALMSLLGAGTGAAAGLASAKPGAVDKVKNLVS